MVDPILSSEFGKRRLVEDAKAIWLAGVDAVRGDRLIAQTIFLDDDFLHLGDLSIERADFDRVLIVGAGKAVASMTVALDQVISPHIPTYGWVNVPAGTFDSSHATIGKIEIHIARPRGINEPTKAVLKGTQEILKLVRSAEHRDLVLVVLSGGGSALLACPVEGVSIDDKLSVTRLLSGAGADIQQLNTVRKQISLVKGGGLARASRGGRLVTLVLSDVLGDPVDVIASGPTVDNQSTADDAMRVLNIFDPAHSLPSCIYNAIEQNKTVHRYSIASETIILGNNASAVDAAGIRAESLGYSHAMTAAIDCEGAAEAIGSHLADMALSMLNDRDAGKQTPDCLITGGEPTVQLAPPNIRGRGGRNTHLVLAAMNRFRELRIDIATTNRIVILSGGTDGEDGPTDAAGAILSPDVWQAAHDQMLDSRDYLTRSDSYTFFKLTGGLLVTGLTHTNVCDIRVVLIDHEPKRSKAESPPRMIHRMVLGWFLVFAALLGCKDNVPAAAPISAVSESSLSDSDVVAIDRLHREVRFSSIPQRIVSLTPATTELMFAIGAGSQLVGVTESCNYPPEATKLARVGRGTLESLSRETIVSLQPDLVLCKWDNHQPLMTMLDEFKIPSLAIGPETLDEFFAEAIILGQVTGRVDETEKLVSHMKQRLESLTSQVKLIPESKRRRVFYEVWDEPLMTAGPGSFIEEVLRLAGMNNIFSDAQSNYPNVSDEVVVSRNPDVILSPSTHASQVSVEKLLQRQGWGEVKAIQEKQVFVINGDQISRCGPRLLDALEEIIRVVYPDERLQALISKGDVP